MKTVREGVGVEEQEEKTLCEQLGIINTSIGFNLVIIFAVLLSFWSVLIQRRQIACSLAGDAEAVASLPPVYPIQHGAAAIFTGALGFFLCLAFYLKRQADAGEDCAAKRSANVNVLASFLVVLAAALRLVELDTARQSEQITAPEEDVLLA